MICPMKLVTERESTTDADTAIDIKVLIDCRVEGDFIDQTYATIMGIKKQALDKPIAAQNVDGSLNEAGTITHYVNVTLEISEQKQNEWLYITKLRKQKLSSDCPGSNGRILLSTGN